MAVTWEVVNVSKVLRSVMIQKEDKMVTVFDNNWDKAVYHNLMITSDSNHPITEEMIEDIRKDIPELWL